MVEQHVEVLSFLAASLPAVPEQVIEVPILSLPVCAVQRAVPLEPQMAEQLLEVPTPFYIFEQNADIPVPRNRGARGGLQGFHPEQGSAASFPEQIVDVPVHNGGLRGFLPRQSSTAQSPQTADIPSSSGGPQGFLPEQLRLVVAEVVEVFKISPTEFNSAGFADR